MELLEIQSNSELRKKYLEVGLPGFFTYLLKIYRKFATKIEAMFGFTYECEQLFSFMKLSKNFSENKTDCLTLVISNQSQNCIDISAWHDKNCQQNDWTVTNEFSILNCYNFCTMYLFYLHFSKWHQLVIMFAISCGNQSACICPTPLA